MPPRPDEVWNAYIQGAINYQEAVKAIAAWYNQSGLLPAGEPERRAAEILKYLAQQTGVTPLDFPREAPGVAGAVAAPGPAAPPPVAGPTPTSVLGEDPRAATFRQLEQEPSGLRQSFQAFLAGLPGVGSLNPLLRSALENRQDVAEQSFFLQPQQTAGGQDVTFQDFLQGGGRILNPAQTIQQLQNIAGFARRPSEEVPGAFSGIVGRLANDPNANFNAFQQFLTPAVQGVTPFLRGSAGRLAERLYGDFLNRSPEESFLQWAANRGGIFGR